MSDDGLIGDPLLIPGMAPPRRTSFSSSREFPILPLTAMNPAAPGNARHSGMAPSRHRRQRLSVCYPQVGHDGIPVPGHSDATTRVPVQSTLLVARSALQIARSDRHRPASCGRQPPIRHCPPNPPRGLERHGRETSPYAGLGTIRAPRTPATVLILSRAVRLTVSSPTVPALPRLSGACPYPYHLGESHD
jgi:hypothetical protein